MQMTSQISGQFGSGAARSLAAAVGSVADDVRALALQADSAAAGGWRSTSADAFRERLAEEVAAVRVAAARLDFAVEAVRQHAVAVDGVLSSVGDVFGPVLDLGAGLDLGTALNVGTVRRVLS